MRISGLYSGLDIEQMIEDIMKAERIPVDRVFRQKVKAEWKRDAYREVNTKLLQLRTKVFDLRLQATFSTRKVTSTNPSLVTATATGSAVDGTYEIEVSQLAKPAQIAVRLDALDEGETVTVYIEGVGDGSQVLEISGGETPEALVKRINSDAELGLMAFYDPHENRVVITTKATGENVSFKIENEDEYPVNLAEFFGVESVEYGDGFVRIAKGTNAQFRINGYETQRESNTFEINGLRISLHGKTEANSPVRITVERDVDAVFEQIKGFVDLYNEIITELNLKLREPVNRAYEPLTDAEKEAMNEKEIERWEAAAKSGLLRSDPIISGILSELRMAIAGARLDTIGIKTGSWQEYGRLHIDETKLKQAIADSPDEVMELFTRQLDGENVGLAAKLSKILDNGMERISSTAGRPGMAYDTSYLGEQIRRYESRLEAMEERLVKVENRYWNQFIAMERALSELYAQSDWLYQQLLALQG